eukprot:Polyplicarium_translucidae@DN944_c0_g1_i2.p2
MLVVLPLVAASAGVWFACELHYRVRRYLEGRDGEGLLTVARRCMPSSSVCRNASPWRRRASSLSVRTVSWPSLPDFEIPNRDDGTGGVVPIYYLTPRGNPNSREEQRFGWYTCNSCHHQWESAQTFIGADGTPTRAQECGRCGSKTWALSYTALPCAACGQWIPMCRCQPDAPRAPFKMQNWPALAEEEGTREALDVFLDTA